MDPSQEQPTEQLLTPYPNPQYIRRSLRALQTSIRFIPGVGPKRAQQLADFGLKTVEDLLYHLPFRYEDRRQLIKIHDATVGREESFTGRLVRLEKKYLPHRRSSMLLGHLADDTGSLDLVWYRAPAYLIEGLSPGQRLLVHGTVEQGLRERKRIVHPAFELLTTGDDQDLRRIVPIYLRPGGVPLSLMRKWLASAIRQYSHHLAFQLPQSILESQGLLAPPEALSHVHRPEPDSDINALNSYSSRAHRSLIFDELFYLQLGLGIRKKNRLDGEGVLITQPSNRISSRMKRLLPFQLTRAQERVLAEIYQDMASSRPMQRLIQGDVGSGKTIVAWFASLRVIEHRYQAVWMAPTELLAEQHFSNLEPFCKALGIRVLLLTGSLPAKDRKAALSAIAGSEVDVVVGTHAVIQEGIHVPRMGLGVIDEQHRFGVIQRLSLQRLTTDESVPAPVARSPHMLLMSATPIPRSLAMVLYGDMEVSFLDEMPPGRVPVQTTVFRESQRKALYDLVLRELRSGHQAFIVYPLVEASEQLHEVRDATQMAEKMRQSAFKEFGVGLIHGRMPAAERDRIMREFKNGSFQVLVSTTVIEVGIDIPNATVMVVEHAERFGLSQLHQLRGRVGRGPARGYCLLVNRGRYNPVAEQRLRVMEREHNGFKIAEADLVLRGPGEFLGTRQSGLGDFRLVNLARDAHLLVKAREQAQNWLQNDPGLTNPESVGMREILLHRWGQRLELGAVV